MVLETGVGFRRTTPRGSGGGDIEIDSKKLAAEAAWLAEQKKGVNIQVLDVRDQIRIADFFVLVTATSKPHAKALFNEIHTGLKALGESHRPAEGTDLGWWVLLDYGDVVVHVMQEEARTYYDLDNLYGECEELDWQGAQVRSRDSSVRSRDN